MGKLCLDSLISEFSDKLTGSDKRYNEIKFKDITVVFQGPVEKDYTPVAIESIHRFLPGARIILSTWPGQKTDGLPCDDVVFNEDPGAPVFTKKNGNSHADNRNRLLVSTQGGLARANSLYTLKLRSDCILLGDGIVRNYGRYPQKTEDYNIMQEKLVIGEQCNLTKLHFAENTLRLPFHMSDWFFFGLTEDLKTYFWGTEIESLEQMTKWEYKKSFPISSDDEIGKNWKRRYNAEQYYFLSALRRKYEIDYQDLSDYSEEAERVSKIAIINNFVILNAREHEIINAKRQNKQPWDLSLETKAEYFTNSLYEETYKEYFG